MFVFGSYYLLTCDILTSFYVDCLLKYSEMGAAPDPMVTSFYLFREDGLNFERNYLDEDAVVNCLVNY